MKINEILIENEDHIKLYWALKGIDISSYYNAFDTFSGDSNTFRGKNNLLQLSSHVYSLLSNSDWQYLENDADFDAVYNQLLELYDAIQEKLNR